jgi:hypothetical protein
VGIAVLFRLLYGGVGGVRVGLAGDMYEMDLISEIRIVDIVFGSRDLGEDRSGRWQSNFHLNTADEIRKCGFEWEFPCSVQWQNSFHQPW